METLGGRPACEYAGVVARRLAPVSNDCAIEELSALEPITHRLPSGAGRAEIEALLEVDFIEIGASGTVYERSFVVDTVVKRYARKLDPDDSRWVIEDFSTRQVASGLYLVSYRLTFGGRISRRSTLWRKHESGYLAVYHQGTLCAQGLC